MPTRYAHINIVAHDWRRLADFYSNVFGCVEIPPQRDYAGELIDQLTGVDNAQIRGIHLRLPGYGDDGPTLEIFTYNQSLERPFPALNRLGLAHIAFAVDDVQQARDALLAAGGGQVGELVTLQPRGAGVVEVIYMTDPEGNIVELQKWRKE